MLLEKQQSLEEFRLQEKAKLRILADTTFTQLYSSREAIEDFIKALTKLANGQTIPVSVQTTWDRVAALRLAQTTAIQNINAAATKQEIRDKVQFFKTTVKTL